MERLIKYIKKSVKIAAASAAAITIIAVII